MDTYELDLTGRRMRQRHSAEFKAAVIQEYMRPGISVAAVALAHSPDANMLRKWVIEAEHKAGAPAAPLPTAQPSREAAPAPAFIPLALASPGSAPTGEIQIELLHAGATTCCAIACCTPTRHRWRCSTPAPARQSGAFLWSYSTTGYDSQRPVVFDFAESRVGRHPMEFLGHLGPKRLARHLVCDDYAGHKALFAQGVNKAGCLRHARRKFHELWTNHKSTLAEQAVTLFARLYEVEQEVRRAIGRRAPANASSRPGRQPTALHAWLTVQRPKVPPGSATARAINYSLGRRPALVRYIDAGGLPADNN